MTQKRVYYTLLYAMQVVSDLLNNTQKKSAMALTPPPG